ncbi:MAG: mechanosensitive ion channel family protein [Armatimonadota bacterium]
MIAINDFLNFNISNYAVNILLPMLWSIFKILFFFLLVRLIAYRLIDKVLKSVSDREGKFAQSSISRVQTLGSLVKSIIFYVLIFITGVMLLRKFDIDPAPVLTAAGVVGLAVGFGAQRLVRDIISGFFIVLENQYSVGEYITIGAITGTVVELGMRITRLRDDIGKLVVIANGDIIQVINHSRGPVQAILEVSITSDSDLDKARAVINEAGQEIFAKVDGILAPPKADGITAVDSAKVTIRISGEVKPGRQDAVQTALREMIYRKFREGEIKLV